MNRIFFWISLFIILLSFNIYLGWYSNSLSKVVFNEPPSIAADVSGGSTIPEDTVLPEQRITMIFTGDVMLGRTVMIKSNEHADHHYPFRKTADRLSAADITMVNLENPIIDDCPVHLGGFVFCSEPASIEALIYAGVDIVNLANNHTFNWGKDGFYRTVDLLSQKNIDSVGYDNIVYKDVNSFIIAFMGFDFVTNPYFLSLETRSQLKNAKASSDLLIVNVHWGNEYKNAANLHQRNMARQLIEHGADIIIGHHPHWVQDLECYERNEWSITQSVPDINLTRSISDTELVNGEYCDEGSIPVYYSLGNFVFDQMWSEETKKGGAVEIIIKDGGYQEAKFFPTYMSEWAQPEWLDR